MRKVHRQAALIAVSSALGLAFAAPAQAQYVNSDSRSYGMYLPSPIAPSGQDEVRAADGTTCRSSISGNGPVLDLGGIGAQGRSNGRLNGTVYGRIVIQLGDRPKRINCRSLYQLEIERLRHELRQAKSGGAIGGVETEDFASGWTSGDE